MRSVAQIRGLRSIRRAIVGTAGVLLLATAVARPRALGRIAVAGLGALLLVLMNIGCRSSGLEAVEAAVRRAFPEVAQLSTEALAAWLADPNRRPPILLDVRRAEEFALSHLPGAVHATPGAPLPTSVLALERDTPIVAYCSVGYRSSRFVRRLRAAGFQAVHNLEGSIFAWANEGRAVVRDGQPVSEVHPFDERWGRLLDPKRHPAADEETSAAVDAHERQPREVSGYG